jgi:hypothetical protein
MILTSGAVWDRTGGRSGLPLIVEHRCEIDQKRTGDDIGMTVLARTLGRRLCLYSCLTDPSRSPKLWGRPLQHLETKVARAKVCMGCVY